MFMKLFQNEWMKMNSKRQGLYFNLFIIVMMGGIGLVIKLFVKGASEEMDAYTFLSLLSQMMPMIIMLFGVVIGAQIVTDEFKDGTIKQLLIRPASRASVLMSKYVAAIVMFLLTYVVMIVAGFAIGAVFFGIGEGSIVDQIVSISYGIPFSIFLLTVSFAAGVFTTSLGLSIGIGLFINIFSSMFGLMAGSKEWSKYVVLKYTSLAPYANGAVDSLGVNMWFALTITILTIALFAILSIVRFRTREIN
ncbi:ABC transporter permease [Paenibacillus guangzhouensis]|uniref:ABC transporter permease n=1 Tax=Paenibacillus guangzhouensis TaxID=1473112 RepID=UPI0012674BFD|nr:ABC transporter permease [Paenibacillus guangzhouensis]